MQMHGMDFKNQITNSLYLGVCLGVLGASAVAFRFLLELKSRTPAQIC